MQFPIDNETTGYNEKLAMAMHAVQLVLNLQII